MINASPDTIRATASAIARAALFDDKITEGDEARIAAWSEALHPHGFTTSTLLDAVTTYYATNEDGRTMQVADLIRRAKLVRREQSEPHTAADAHGVPALPASVGQGSYRGLPINAGGEPVWAAYDLNGAIDRPCLACHAEPDCACITKNDEPQRIPCLSRLVDRPIVSAVQHQAHRQRA